MPPKRFRISITVLLALIGFAAIAIASWNISDRTRKLKKEQASFSGFKTRMLSNDERFRTLLALDFEEVEQRNAIRLLQKHWEQVEYKAASSLWPTIDGERYYVGLFHSSVDDYPEGPNVTIAVLWEKGETVVDALAISSTERRDFHWICTDIDTDGTYVISRCPYPFKEDGSSDGCVSWVAGRNGFILDSERSAKKIMETRMARARESGKLPTFDK